MRILWFTHIPIAPLLNHWGRKTKGTGFWIHSLIDPLNQSPAVSRIGVVYAGPDGHDEHVEIDDVDYYGVGQSYMAQRTGIGKRHDENRCLQAFIGVIEKFQPDIIHIHGTERFYGRLKVHRLTDVPTIVSIQGIMGECARHAWGDKTFFDIIFLTSFWEAGRLFPTLRLRSNFLGRAQLETQILNSVNAVIGRTDWDRGYCRKVAKQTPYHHVDEMMRPEFFGPRWNISNAPRHRIYTSGRLTFLKGIHVFLEAMAILKEDYPDLQVRIAGQISQNSENRYLQNQVRQFGLTDTVRFLDWIPGPQIVEELLAAHCYVNTSFIENGCNALQEAMLLGCPCVATFTGGMTTTLRHRQTGLMAPAGCAHMFADAVRELFENDSLCESLGNAAREVAIARHNPERILEQLIAAYTETIQRAEPNGF